MGIAYYANYFVWFEEARTEYFRAKGYPYTKVEEKGVYLPVVEAHCTYKAPARYDDPLEIHTEVIDQSRTTMTFAYQIFICRGGFETRPYDEKLIAEGKTVHVFINQEGKPVAIPEEVKKILPEIKENKPTYETP
ncbi:MAG: acyl-CoA thioesterase [Candidatus Omnitrophica bacterium]|nr:acyl-CoA thioesterase [Candidatus Omnitrophota bacterium]